VQVGARAENGRFMLDVDDDGPGLPGGDIGHLLQRGVRADSRVEGQGIGLAVVGEIVQACDGSVRLEKSRFGGGRVHIELPAL
jgi:two-component system, OmpR family, sensor histidine kinase PhoQ